VKLLLFGATQVVTCAGPAPRRGSDLDRPGVVIDGAILIDGGLIERVGPTALLLEATRDLRARGEVREIPVHGRAVVPGFVDPHTHVVFAGHRAAEVEMRVRGKSYLEILEAGGGILDTVSQVRASSRDDLVRESLPRLARMLALGTTTAEVKSGYGLALEPELAMLEAVARLAVWQPIELIPTFLGAHACPRHVDRDAYVIEVADRMIPEVARRGLARFVDVFCDAGAFDCTQARRVLEAARRHGLGLKLHADEIRSIGATPLGVELGCTSLDHLEVIADGSVPLLAGSPTVGTLLPGTGFILGLGFAPARKLIEAGAAIALATDCNPGSCYTESMALIQTLACAGLRMTPGEALVASTLNAAHAIGLSDRVGSLEPGKQADLLVLEGSDYREIAYHFGTSPVRAVLKHGRLVHGRLDL
jgi:imidazolonepropionase